MTPRADFTCLSPKCRQDGAATVYEDLPIATTRCPVCGSKRVQRLYNKIGVLRGAQQDRDPRLTSSSHLNRSTALLQSGYDHHDAVKPGYTPPPGGVHDAGRYNKLTSFGMNAADVAGITPGKGAPLTPVEIMREKRTNPAGAVALMAAQAMVGIPTAIVGRDDTK